ncbi:hypothetical protein J4471_02420 [Candidatus Woesearchaeota archaeon]|nr:hypothetical protein [Candidatus Woesearchaeota archaeon]
MQRGDTVSGPLQFMIIGIIIYIILIFFVIPFSYAGTFKVDMGNFYNLTVLLYSFFISLFVNVILFGSNKKRKWFFE